jgi:hypothetical protein
LGQASRPAAGFRSTPDRSRFRPHFAIEATAGELSNNKLAWRSVASAVLLLIPVELDARLEAMERAMNEIDFNQPVDAVRKEIAVAPEDSLAGLRASEELSKTADDRRRTRRASTPMVRIRRVGEGQKRYR